jgi:hypothetical protein
LRPDGKARALRDAATADIMVYSLPTWTGRMSEIASHV